MMLRSPFFVAVLLSAIHFSLSEDWNTLWKDDFNGVAGALPTEWRFDIGHGPLNNNWGTGQIEYDTKDPDNVCLDGKGNLLITPRRNSEGKWTSARIETEREDFRPPQGGKMAMEGRIRLPDVTGDSALGYWPAFWAMGNPVRHGKSWPSIGEIDIMENVNIVNRVWGTLHCGISPKGPCNEPTGLSKNRPCPSSSCASGFHVYRFEWDESVKPHEMRWYVDGQQYNKITSDELDSITWDNMTNNSGYFILLDVAMGGNFPNGESHQVTPTSTTIPGHSMVIDYVAVYTSS